MRIPGLVFFLIASLPVFSQKKYFQQQADHSIDVSLSDESHILRAFEKITYTNNSDDTLRFIFFHLWPNAYHNDRSAFTEHQVENGETGFYFSKKDKRGFIDSLYFRVDNEEVNISEYNNHEDVILLELNKPLLPHAQVEITTPFRVVLPEVFSRLGHRGQAYQVSQWYPKPAVYDHKGWHPMPYLDQGEFYSEFGSYTVRITVPANYVVAATGDLQEESEKQFIKNRSLVADSALIGQLSQNPASSAQTKTLTFKQDRVHDFAWFANKQFLVEYSADTAASGKITECYSYFLPSDLSVYTGSSKIIASTINYLSKHIGEYPYRHASVVSGYLLAGGGMEYPNITVIGKVGSRSTLKTVIVHEVGHNWFYGMLANNERDHPWMDESVNSFYENKIIRLLEVKKNHTAGNISIGEDNLLYLLSAKQDLDQPVDIHAQDYTELNYGGIVYNKGERMMAWLESSLGETLFERCMKEYFETWKFKHPYPEDMRRVFEQESGRDLSWFFEQGLKTNRKIDFAFKQVKKSGSTEDGRLLYTIQLKSRTGFDAPVLVSAMAKDSVLAQYVIRGSGFDTTLAVPAATTVFSIDRYEVIPEVRVNNNAYRLGGLFPKFRFRPKVGTTLGNNAFHEVYFLPAAGYNHYDKFMLGLLLHNIRIPNNPFQFALAPMYAFGSKAAVGTGIIGYSIYPGGGIQELRLAVQGNSFHHNVSSLNIPNTLFARHIKVAPSLYLNFRQRRMRKPNTDRILLKYYYVQNDDFQYTLDVTDSLFKPGLIEGAPQHYGSFSFLHRNDRTFNPFNWEIHGIGNAQFIKVGLTANLQIDYHMKNRAFYVRAYAGKFFYLQNSSGFSLRPQFLNATVTSVNDFVYDETYIARNQVKGALSQQVAIEEGGFKMRTLLYTNPIGENDNWLTAVNLRSDLPFKSPVRLQVFLDAATYADAGRRNPSGNKLIYEAGLELHLARDLFVLYMPLLLSKDLREYSKTVLVKNRFTQNMSFALNLKKIDWLRTRDVVKLIDL